MSDSDHEASEVLHAPTKRLLRDYQGTLSGAFPGNTICAYGQPLDYLATAQNGSRFQRFRLAGQPLGSHGQRRDGPPTFVTHG